MRGKLSLDTLDRVCTVRFKPSFMFFISLQLLCLIRVQAFARQAKKFPKYRQRLTSTGRRFHTAKFEDDPDFNIRNHVRAVRLPEPAGKKELEDLVSCVRICSRFANCFMSPDGSFYCRRLGSATPALGVAVGRELS